MSSEFNRGPTAHAKEDRSELIANVLQEIEEYYKNTDLTSARFQAFADYTDYLDAKFGPKHKDPDERSGIPLIKETIRQRKNGLTGYKQEFERASQFRNNLTKAMGINVISRNSYNHNAFNKEIDYMQRIKNRLIDTRNQQSTQ